MNSPLPKTPAFVTINVITLRAFYGEVDFDKRDFVVFVFENVVFVGLNVNKIDDASTQRAVRMIASIDKPVMKKFVFF